MLRVARLVLDRAGTLPLRIGVNRGRGVRRRLRPRVPAYLLGQGRRHQPRGAGDGQGRAGAGAGHASRWWPGRRPSSGPPSCRRSWSRARPSRSGRSPSAPWSVPATRSGPACRSSGRDAELAVLREALAERACPATAGSSRSSAKPGIGKSRLVAELLRGVGDVPVVGVRCEEYESSTPYFPFRALLRDVLGVPAGAEAAVVAQRLVDRVSLNAPAPGPVAAAARRSRWTSGCRRPRRRRSSTSSSGRTRLEEVVTELLGWVLPTSTVLVVEDAHLMDDASADLLHRWPPSWATGPGWSWSPGGSSRSASWPDPERPACRCGLPPLDRRGSLELVRDEAWRTTR